jgi:predicted nucleic acid-binding Zn finger protein
MSTNESETQDCIEPRLRRGLSECISILPEYGRAAGAPGLFVAIGENENGEYLLDIETGSCECPDATYNLDADSDTYCKHVQRARVICGEKSLLHGVLDQVDIDGNIGAHVPSSSPTFITADGGEVINGTTGEEIDDTTEEANVWSSPPRQETDKHGVPTGSYVVECLDCGIETTTSLAEFASHRDGCKHEGREAGR